jgi:hypothetical protein
MFVVTDVNCREFIFMDGMRTVSNKCTGDDMAALLSEDPVLSGELG